ncbi:protein PfhB1 [[Pasteurella] mairii]|uniref:Protein PfhB1 n=1 Tax=[Pasteurella] mairii TaxID=757 RepID=A0A379B815_9PAST|nr:protein PfhB1 [[Pasteurella] mairii]
MNRPKISLSKITSILAISYALPGYAEIQPVNTNTQVNRVGKIEIVNIAKPSDSGLSHNQYAKFNVDKSGAVLNNALHQGKSELAGQLDKNPHLKNQAANIILNEVVSREPSNLLGKQEIFGQKADYVLANPNGISCDGCGFINTPKASLVVGKPTVNKGELTDFDVRGENALTTSGKVTGQLDQLDLIAPTVTISGQLNGAKNVNVVMGKNTVKRDKNGKLTVQVEEAKGQILDGKIAGSMLANRIRIHSTDQRATLDIVGADIEAKDVLVQAGNAKFKGKITTVPHEQNRQYLAENRVTVEENHSTKNEKYQKTTVKADNLIVDVENRLDIVGADLQTKQAGLIGGETHFGTQTTIDEHNTRKHQSKGLWFREEIDNTQKQTVHRTTVSSDKLNVVATKGKITGEAVKLNSQDAFIYGENGIDLKGVAQSTWTEAESKFKNETIRLKTGSSSQSADTQDLIASELQFKNATLGGGDIQFSAVKGQIDGQFLIQNQGKAEFASQETQNTYHLDDRQKFWGGLAGSKTLGTGKNETVQHGTDLTIKGLAYIDAGNGVNIKGSRVLAGEGYVLGNQGKLVIDTAEARVIEHKNSRQGTLFDITKARENSFSDISTAQGSILTSDSNLQLLSSEGINVIGSKVQAADTLTIDAPIVTVHGAKNNSLSTTEEAGFGISFKGDKPKVTFNTEAALKGLITGIGQGEKIDLLNIVKGNTQFEAQGSITFGIYNNNQQSRHETHTRAEIEGGNINVVAQDVNILGGKVTASKGDLTIQAQKLKTSAQTDHLNTDKKSTNVGTTVSAKVNNSGASSTVSFGVNHQQQNTQTESVQPGQLAAKKDLNLHAEQIQHQGSQLVAGNNLIEKANQVEHLAVDNKKIDSSKNIDVGLHITSEISKEKAISSSGKLSATGGHENTQTTTAQATKLEAGNHIAVNAQTLQDTATQYQAGGNLNLTSQQHTLQSAINSVNKETLKAGANIGVSGSTSDLTTVNLKVNVGANYQQNQTSSEKAQKASLNANNIAINTENLYSQADMQASGKVALSAAESAVLAQSSDREYQIGGGFKADIGVGALVIPAANTAIPTADVSATVNSLKGSSQEAVSTTVKGQSVEIQSGKQTLLQGTNIDAENAKVNGNNVVITAANNNKKLTDVSVGAGVSIGKDISTIGLNGNIKVNHEATNTHTTGTINAQNLTVQAHDGITLAGIQTTVKNVNLDSGKGNLNLTALQNDVQKTNVGAILSLNGGVSEQTWTPSGGSASLDVNVVRNQTHTSTIINSDSARLNVGSTTLTGSALNTNTVSGTIAGDLQSIGLVNKINETKLNLSAGGSGKFTPYPAQDWNKNLIQDQKNGAIAGIKAEIKTNIDIKRQQTNTPVDINTKQDNLVVNGNLVKPIISPEKDTHTTVTAHLNTNIEEMIKKAQEQIKNGQTPFIQVVELR